MIDAQRHVHCVADRGGSEFVEYRLGELRGDDGRSLSSGQADGAIGGIYGSHPCVATAIGDVAIVVGGQPLYLVLEGVPVWYHLGLSEGGCGGDRVSVGDCDVGDF